MCDTSLNPFNSIKGWLYWLGFSNALAVLLELLAQSAGATFAWSMLLGRGLFVAGVLFLAQWVYPFYVQEKGYVWTWSNTVVVSSLCVTAFLYRMSGATWVAWGLLMALYVFLLNLDALTAQCQMVFLRWVWRGFLIVIGSSIPVMLTEVESRFAEEEFFVALQVLALVSFWVLLLSAHHILIRYRTSSPQSGLRLAPRWLVFAVSLMFVMGMGVTIAAYQRSFYPTVAPSYPGISPETPFVCGTATPDSQIFAGDDVFRRLIAQVAKNPRAGTPEYGWLALATGEVNWAIAFHDSILEEAAAGRFTQFVPNVKYIQRDAARRAYYLSRVDGAFPGLFSADELTVLKHWFAAINQRAMTVEWMDWMYALAFSKWPEGLYENQEIGAGLLALLESEGLSNPALSSANQTYLSRYKQGWTTRFRVTDDALIYQPDWITNALFQSQYSGTVAADNQPLSFEWLLLQSLPDGYPIGYNHTFSTSLAMPAYLGAHLLNDPRYIWLSGRALDYAESHNLRLFAQPGFDQPLDLVGHSPTVGSCVIYGDSGLPNQVGPLAPDKIVFRDGWAQDSAYLMLNLRFTGWHRYKATNTITLVYQAGVLADDKLDRQPITWLPAERRLFRDKRIPRENLNGLVVQRTGMSAVLYQLTGIGEAWSQDPPYYAEIIAFETQDGLDWSHTRLQDWHGWRHDRWIYFYHQGGPIVVVDEAQALSDSRAAFVWHLSGTEEPGIETQRVRLRDEHDPVEVVLLSVDQEGGLEFTPDSGNRLTVSYTSEANHLHMVTVFLPEKWIGATLDWQDDPHTLHISNGDQHIVLPIMHN